MKKLLLACFALTLVLCLLPTTAEAATEGNFTYEISDGKATITNYNGSGGDVAIPSTLGGCPVTSIGDDAFSGCTGLTAVTIPDSVTTIGICAFHSCTGLTGVYITDLAAWCAIDFSELYSNPLFYAKNLYLDGSLVTELTIPDSVTTIDRYAFYGCTGLTSVTIPDSVTTIDWYAFSGCTGLTAVTIGDSVTTIGDRAFYGCTALEEITIPVSMFSIADNAFKDVPLKTVHYGGTKEQWEKIDLNNNVCFAAAEVKTTEKPADPAPDNTAEPAPTEPANCSHTGYLVAIIALSVALAGSITLNLLQHKKKKA